MTHHIVSPERRRTLQSIRAAIERHRDSSVAVSLPRTPPLGLSRFLLLVADDPLPQAKPAKAIRGVKPVKGP